MRKFVLIVGASPDRINHNAVMRRYVCDGFNDVLGSNSSCHCSLENAIDEIQLKRPSLVLIFGSCMPDVCDYGPIRDKCDRYGSILTFWLHDDPYEFDFNFRAAEVADWIFTNDRWASLHYEHPQVYFLPMAASVRAHYRAWSESKNYDVFFCGVGFPNRVALLSDLQSVLKKLRVCIKGADWPSSLSIAQNQRLSNGEWSDVCASSSITLNIGRTLHLANKRYQLDATTPGPRTFEAAMAGTVQMMFVDGLEVADFFEPEKEIILFDNPKDFSAKLEELLLNKDRLELIALNAQKRAIRDHTYAARAQQIIDCIGGELLLQEE